MKRDNETEGEGAPPLKKVRTQKSCILTANDINKLISDACNKSIKAQNKLMRLSRKNLFDFTPDEINFLGWQTQDLEETLEDRCYREPAYAAFVIKFFNQIGVSFPHLFEETRKRAEQKVGTAQTNLATMYFFGQDIPQDLIEAARLYQRAADQGNVYAQEALTRLISLSEFSIL